MTKRAREIDVKTKVPGFFVCVLPRSNYNNEDRRINFAKYDVVNAHLISVIPTNPDVRIIP